MTTTFKKYAMLALTLLCCCAALPMLAAPIDDDEEFEGEDLFMAWGIMAHELATEPAFDPDTAPGISPSEGAVRSIFEPLGFRPALTYDPEFPPVQFRKVKYLDNNKAIALWEIFGPTSSPMGYIGLFDLTGPAQGRLLDVIPVGAWVVGDIIGSDDDSNTLLEGKVTARVGDNGNVEVVTHITGHDMPDAMSHDNGNGGPGAKGKLLLKYDRTVSYRPDFANGRWQVAKRSDACKSAVATTPQMQVVLQLLQAMHNPTSDTGRALDQFNMIAQMQTEDIPASIASATQVMLCSAFEYYYRRNPQAVLDWMWQQRNTGSDRIGWLVERMLGMGLLDKSEFIRQCDSLTSGEQHQWLERHTGQWGFDEAVG